MKKLKPFVIAAGCLTITLLPSEGKTQCCLGNTCGAFSNPLTSSWEIPMNKFNFRFADPTGPLNDNQNFVGIGTTCIPRAKLEVLRRTTSNTLSMVTGTFIENQDIATSPYTLESRATYSLCDGKNKGNYGLVGEAIKAGSNIGVKGYSADQFTGGSNAILNYGLQGIAIDGEINYGVYGSASGTNTNTITHYAGFFAATTSNNNTMNQNIAVYGSSSNNMTVVTDNISSYNYTLNFDKTFNNIGSYNYALNVGNAVTNNVGVVGISDDNAGNASVDIGVYGQGVTAGYFAGPLLGSMPVIIFSDSKIKTDIKKIVSGLEVIKKLNPVTYHFKASEFPELNLDQSLQYGFIAQELEKVLPDLVKESQKPEFKDKDGKVISKGGTYKGIAYEEIIPILTRSIQEQQEQISEQQKQIEALQQMVAKLMPAEQPSEGRIQHDVELDENNTVVLDQNTPNPFAEKTVITYQLPQNYVKAQIQFFNTNGQLIKTVDLTEKGKGQLNVFANDLTNGMYTYTLVVDGKKIDTKRMVRSR